MLSPAEKTQVAALARREGGMEVLIPLIADAITSESRESALSMVGGAITVTISDRAKVRSFFNSAVKCRLSLAHILDAILVAEAKGDDSQLGPLLILLVVAVKEHLGR